MLSPSDTAIVFLLALLLFGPEQLPKLARQLGEAMRRLQSTTHAFMQEMERAADSTEQHEHPSPDSTSFEAPPLSEDASVPEASSWGDDPEQGALSGDAPVERAEGQPN